jgi:hypothetical protein
MQMMTARQLSLVLTAISCFGMALPVSVAAADAAANDLARPANSVTTSVPVGDDFWQPMTMVSIQDLTLESDFTVFMAPEVPAEIRRVALRKLWRLLGWDSDGLGEYEADYTAIVPARRAPTVDDTVAAELAARR